MNATDRSAEIADRIHLSYRAVDADPDATDIGVPHAPRESGFNESHLVHDRIQQAPFLTYLRRVHGGRVSVGDEWIEFVNCGCGTTSDVLIRVEAIDGGAVFGERTRIDLEAAGEIDSSA